MDSLFINNLTFNNHRLDQLFGAPTLLQSFTTTTTAPTYSGGVSCIHLYKVLGLPLPPPQVSQFNLPRLRLRTGLRHGPRASNLHHTTIFTCGTRHQPRPPNQFPGSQLTALEVWINGMIFLSLGFTDCLSSWVVYQWISGWLLFCIFDLEFVLLGLYISLPVLSNSIWLRHMKLWGGVGIYT